MAEAGTEILVKGLEKLGSPAWNKVMFAKNLKTHIKELQELKSAIKAALRGVDPFEEGGEIKPLRHALVMLDNFFDEQEAKSKQKVLMGGSKFTVQARLFFSSSNQIASSLITAEKVSAILAELQRIKNARDLVHTVTCQSYRNINQGFFSHESGHILDTEVIGRDEYRDNIITRLFRSSNGIESFSAVAIVGIGGLGKTTLAQYVFNDERVKGCFDSRLWVSATPDSDVKDFLVKIIGFVTGEYPVNCEMAHLHLQFSRAMQMIAGKKCLLVLDSLWYRDNFGDVWLRLRNLLKSGSLGAIEFKILATTRSEAIADIMGITDPYMLSELTEEDTWILLRRFAIKQGKEMEPGIEVIGEEIAEMCPKIPLVIMAIGRRLAEKHTVRDWHAFKVKLASNSAFLMEDDKVMQTLKLSYDELGDNLKRCTAYCSLLPKGKVYEIEQVVLIWMALGFVEFRDDKSLEDVGIEYVLDLQRLGFFEKRFYSRENEFQMHDVMHDLMLSIGKSEHQMIDSKTTQIARGVCHVSLSEHTPNWGVLFSEFNGKQLQSILRVSSIEQDSKNVVHLGSGIKNLIFRFPNLKVLDLHDQDIEEVPKSISELIHLRYLDLSGNPMCKLPNSITKLVHLQSLNLSYCRNLHKLPRDMSKMVKLRHLLLDRLPQSITHMPKGIGNLSNLQVLNLFVVIGEDSSTSSGSKGNVAANLAELGHLNNIRGELPIHVAGQSKYLVSEATTAHLEKKTKLTQLTVKFYNSSEEDERFLEGLQPCGNNLRHITIRNYGGNKLPSWMTDDQLHDRFPKLVSIDLFYCKYDCFLYSSIGLSIEEHRPILWIRVENKTSEDEHDHQLKWVPGYLRMKQQLKTGPVELRFTEVRGNGLRELTLRCLFIEGQLASCSPGSGGQQQRDFLVKSCFPNIQILELRWIPELEVIPEEFRDLSSLEKLIISDCRKVKAIPDWIDSLTSLKEIRIYLCPRLEWLPHQISNLSNLELLDIYSCSKTFFDKCQKETGEYWPHIQHIKRITIRSSEDETFSHCNSNNTSSIQKLPAMHPIATDAALSSFISPFFLGGLCLLLFFACFLVYYVKA